MKNNKETTNEGYNYHSDTLKYIYIFLEKSIAPQDLMIPV